MKLLLIATTFCFFQAVLGQVVSRSCKEQFKVAKECMEPDREEMEEHRAEMEAKMQGLKQCMEESGCRMPMSGEELEEMKGCRRRVFQQLIRPQIEACVGELDFEPEMVEPRPPPPPFFPGFHHPHPRGRKGPGEHNPMEKFCPSGAVEEVRRCLKEQMGEEGPPHPRQMFARFRELRAKLAECRALMSAECRSELCACVEGISEDEMEMSMEVCRPPKDQDGPPPHPGSPVQKTKHLVCEGSEPGLGPFGRPHARRGF